MTDEELNKLIHGQIMGECWHDLAGGVIRPVRCLKPDCGCMSIAEARQAMQFIMPDYCQDLNAIAKVEAKVIEAGGLYYTAIRDVVGWDVHAHQWVTATARQRAEACLKAMELI